MPQSPPCIEGVINLRGRIIPVVDLRKRFETASTESKSNRIIVIRAERVGTPAGNAPFLGLFVDAVLRVITTDKERLLKTSDLLTRGEPAYSGDVYRDGDNLFVVLRPDRILTDVETKVLEEKPLKQ